MLSVFNDIVPIFLLAFLGSLIRRKWLTTDEFWRGLERLSFFLLFPCVLFEHTSKVDFANGNFFSLAIGLIFSLLIVTIIAVFCQKRERFPNAVFTSIYQGSTRFNNYIFFAVGAALFGDAGLEIISTVAPVMIILTNITAVTCFVIYIPKDDDEEDRSNRAIIIIRSICINPFIIASILGISFNYLEIEINDGLNNTIEKIADSALTIGMLVVGAGIKFKIKSEHIKPVIISGVLKLLIMPLLTSVILSLMDINDLTKSIGILFSCLPTASSSYILSRQFGGNAETMSSIITVTTVTSIITTSLIVMIFISS